MLGDDVPPDELNHAPKAGLFFGYPYCHGDGIQDPEFGKAEKCAEMTKPAQKLGPHVAAIGMRFYTGEQFPAEYRGQILIAEHGSWNRSSPIGYRVMRVTVDGGKATSYEPFAEGWLQGTQAVGAPGRRRAARRRVAAGVGRHPGRDLPHQVPVVRRREAHEPSRALPREGAPAGGQGRLAGAGAARRARRRHRRRPVRPAPRRAPPRARRGAGDLGRGGGGSRPARAQGASAHHPAQAGGGGGGPARAAARLRRASLRRRASRSRRSSSPPRTSPTGGASPTRATPSRRCSSSACCRW